MTGLRRGLRAALALATILLSTAACGGGDDGPDSSSARAELEKATSAVLKVLSSPTVGQAGVIDPSAITAVRDPLCDDGDSAGSRWRSSAALTVTDPSDDGDAIVARVIGSMQSPLKTTLYVGDLDDDPALVLPVTYGSGEDAVSLDVTIQRAEQGWAFAVSGRTACTSS